MLFAAGCGGASQGAIAESAHNRGHAQTITEGQNSAIACQVQVAPEVRLMEPACAPDLAERCDGVDSDCDGQIDESCASVGAGDQQPPGGRSELVVGVSFSGGVAPELHLEGVQPLGAPQASGTHFSQRFSIRAPNHVSLAISLPELSTDGESVPPATVSVELIVDHQHLGTFNRSLSAGQSSEMVTLECTLSPNSSHPTSPTVQD